MAGEPVSSLKQDGFRLPGGELKDSRVIIYTLAS